MKTLTSLLIITTMACYICSVYAQANGLKVGYYRHKCPQAESIIKRTVSKALKEDPTLVAPLIRMHFHDCFVRGCDGSILIDSTPDNKAEKESPANFPSLRGFEVIDEAKREIEAICPQVVSCADIIAFAARDSASKAGKMNWRVPAGRKDGRISKEEDIIGNLPPPSFNVQELTDIFEKKGLSQEDMVTLSGAHSIGVSHCSSFRDRLYHFNNTGAADPTLDFQLAQRLRLTCPPADTPDPTVALEGTTPTRLDNRYYTQLYRKRGLLTSDQTLLSTPSTRNMVKSNVVNPSSWRNKFGESMVKMGSIDVLTGSAGEIRKNCRIVL
ncbi:peroxidase 5 [Cryptomeria japonica]|uniref:peroxidase 5 n=1 Tax=Cryptomeria japonica TaxID=3369 RepID=UPI0027DA68D0|nr:peroxidase 5 [Cryptomeria japonica]